MTTFIHVPYSSYKTYYYMNLKHSKLLELFHLIMQWILKQININVNINTKFPSMTFNMEIKDIILDKSVTSAFREDCHVGFPE